MSSNKNKGVMVVLSYDTIKITDIIPADYNPRVMSDHEKIKLKNSIQEFGLVDPIIINLKNMRIIGGHQRYEALLNQYTNDKKYKELNLIKLGDIGWVFTETDLNLKDEAHEKALNIALNKISGGWDNDLLHEVFNDLNEVGFNIDLTGFNSMDEEVQFSNLMNKIEFDDKKKNNNSTNNYDNNINNSSDSDDTEPKDLENPEPYNPNNTDEIINEDTNNIETTNKINSKDPTYYNITLIFDTEDEMVTAYDKLVSDGYTCRMSNS